MTRIPSRALGVWIIAAACGLLMTACQTTSTGSGSEGGQTQETDGGFRAPVEPPPTPSAPTPDPMVKLELRPVYFAYDRSELTAEARKSLREDAAQLKGSSGVTTVEGHTDERGTFEYNLALGDRRANSVKQYLMALGVSGLRAQSYGEQSPAVRGHDESAWRWNRRVALKQ
jgi:peptidoglycan-associated lipoprotein